MEKTPYEELYVPENALVVMRNSYDRAHVAKQLRDQGLAVEERAQDVEGISYLTQHDVHVLVLGEGLGNVVRRIEESSRKGTLTLMLSDTDPSAKPDRRFMTRHALTTYITENLFGEYINNDDAQESRAEGEMMVRAMQKKTA